MMTPTMMQGDNIGNAYILQPWRHNAERERLQMPYRNCCNRTTPPLYTSIDLTNTFKVQKTEVDERHK